MANSPLAIVFTDIEGSSPLWERLGERFRPSLDRHHAILRQAIATGGGQEVKTEGDAFMIAFPAAGDAVRFAFESQEALAREEWPAEVGELKVRIGVHFGEPIRVDEGGGRVDYLGPVVNRAARIAHAARGGQILLSEAAWSAAAGALAGAAVVDLGEHRLRGLEKRERLFQALPASLAARTFLPPATQSVVSTNLPFPETSFVGRERELRQVQALLAAPGTRLVTLTGPGGTGKTRLSLRAGADLLEKFPGGVWFADLTEATDAAGVAKTVAAALGVALTACCPPAEYVADALEFRKEMLLVLDNFEQVVAAAPATAGLWLKRCPKLRVLATSRFLLGIAGEREIALEPLPSPMRPGIKPTPAEVAAHDGTRLFLERARDADPAFALTAENAADIAALVAELEGMPLALELAAARVRVLSPAKILERLKDRFGVLTSTRRDLPARQRSLEGAIEWSWTLLEEFERAAFAQLCAFRGGFDLDAAEAVLDLAAFPGAPPVMDVVQRLREKSFLAGADSKFGVRFRIYIALREFGEAKIADRAALDMRLARYFDASAGAWAAAVRTPGAAEALDRLELEIDNLIAVEARARGRGDGETAGRMALAGAELLAIRGPWDQRVGRLRAALAGLPATPTPTRVRLRARLGEALWDSGDSEGAGRESEGALADARNLGDVPSLLEALGVAGGIRFLRGETAASDEARRELLAQALAAQAPRFQAIALLGLSGRAMRRGERELALAQCAEAEPAARAAGDPCVLARVVGNSAGIRGVYGDLDASIGGYEEAERIFRSIGDVVGAARVVAGNGQRRSFFGRLADGEALLRQAEDELRRAGNRDGLAMVLRDRAANCKRSGDSAQGLALLGEAERIARASGNIRTLAIILFDRATFLARQDNFAAAHACIDESETILRVLEDRRGLMSAANSRAHIALLSGDLELALRIYSGLILQARELSDLDAEATFTSNAGNTLQQLGRFEEALLHSRAAAEMYRIVSQHGGRASALQVCANALTSLGRIAEALAAAKEAVAELDQVGTHAETRQDIEAMVIRLEAKGGG